MSCSVQLRIHAILFGALIFASCMHAPVQQVTGYNPSIGKKAANTATSMIGRPYKYKGDSPAGFDCSGLVRYCYLTAGLDVPHGTKDLQSVTRPVGMQYLQKGDLLFFDLSGEKYSHVGLYIGDQCFVHAPSTGKTVRKNCLREPFWKKHFLEARRFNQ